MRTRSDIIDDFLVRSGWPGAKRTALAGDASFRRYERIFLQGRQAVLMDAPPEKEDIKPFIHIGEHLLAGGFSAPLMHARDTANGLLLLEDLGNDLYTPLLRQSGEREEELYIAAAEVLGELYRQSEKINAHDFSAYGEALMMREANLFVDWFLPAVMGENVAEHARCFAVLWQELLRQLPALKPVLVLRDFHADNLLWLPQREGVKRVGLLDFQDGVIGSPAYDLVSFLEDARRDVSAKTAERVLAYYLENTGIPVKDFMAAYALLGAQRNCKIIGIFVRLAVRDGKSAYLSYLPRVWSHLERDLRHPLLKPLACWMEEVIRPEWRGAIAIPDSKTQATG